MDYVAVIGRAQKFDEIQKVLLAKPVLLLIFAQFLFMELQKKRKHNRDSRLTLCP
ncbi:hypothetical protein HMPREF9080_00853 [Cardiobacterium valvarum F0432]|uniref:Uncharacterized protein n=1 Tax=Cardiobacterium valvarum F0432 TaxID=797473 RepID=G9ZDL9_9GAMM|nr:hypothetical protein HMPREF9080_00853 [Cardiobacterium valvarum F0432]